MNIEDKLGCAMARIKAYIIPNIARTKEEQEAVAEAAHFQVLYEEQLQELNGDVPRGAKSLKIGDYSVTLNDTSSTMDTLTRKNISPTAYAILLNAGLLYRGVERAADRADRADRSEMVQWQKGKAT